MNLITCSGQFVCKIRDFGCLGSWQTLIGNLVIYVWVRLLQIRSWISSESRNNNYSLPNGRVVFKMLEVGGVLFEDHHSRLLSSQGVFNAIVWVKFAGSDTHLHHKFCLAGLFAKAYWKKYYDFLSGSTVLCAYLGDHSKLLSKTLWPLELVFN